MVESFLQIDATSVIILDIGFAVASFLWIDDTSVIRLDVSLLVVVFLWRHTSAVSRLDIRCKAGVSSVIVAKWHSNGELHIFLNNLKRWRRCDSVVYYRRVYVKKREEIRWFCRFVANLKSITVPPGQRERSELKVVVIESKETHIMSSGGTIWWKVYGIDVGTEYDWKIDLEVKWIEEWKVGEELKILQWL